MMHHSLPFVPAHCLCILTLRVLEILGNSEHRLWMDCLRRTWQLREVFPKTLGCFPRQGEIQGLEMTVGTPLMTHRLIQQH